MRGINGLAIHFDAIHRVIAIQVDDELVDRPHSAEGQRGVALQPSAGGIHLERELRTLEGHGFLLRRERQATRQGGAGQRGLPGLHYHAGGGECDGKQATSKRHGEGPDEWTSTVACGARYRPCLSSHLRRLAGG